MAAPSPMFAVFVCPESADEVGRGKGGKAKIRGVCYSLLLPVSNSMMPFSLSIERLFNSSATDSEVCAEDVAYDGEHAVDDE